MISEYLRKIIRPIKDYINLSFIEMDIQNIKIEDLTFFLSKYSIIAWKINNIFLVIDDETRRPNLMWISRVNIPISRENLLIAAIEDKYSVKLFTEKELKFILKGLVVHELYSNMIKTITRNCKFNVLVIDEERKLIGRADILLKKYNCVIELKTSKHKRPEHKYQLALYANILKTRYGILVYSDDVIEIDFMYERDIIKRAYDHLCHIYNMINDYKRKLDQFANQVIFKFGITVRKLIHEIELWRKNNLRYEST